MRSLAPDCHPTRARMGDLHEDACAKTRVPWILFLFLPGILVTGSSHPYKLRDKAFICFNNLHMGCFRPLKVGGLNFLPQTSSLINVHFWLSTRRYPKARRNLGYLDDASVRRSGFKVDQDTAVLTHGYLGWGKADWMQNMTSALLSKGRYNVLEVEWGDGAGGPVYAQAAANALAVGAMLGGQLALLVGLGVSPASLHLIGHGLGAHVMGRAAARVPGLGHVTGLDPAGPGFESADPSNRLDYSQAVFVDVIHTDITGLGIQRAVGHADFYPNGGSRQPGCETRAGRGQKELERAVSKGGRLLDKLMTRPRGLSRQSPCNHIRAVQLYLAAIEECTFHACAEEEVTGGRCPACSGRCPTMAFRAHRASDFQLDTKYFLSTRGEEPYC